MLFYKKQHDSSVDAPVTSNACGYSDGKMCSNGLACDTNKVVSADDRVNQAGWDCSSDSDSEGSFVNFSEKEHDGSSTNLSKTDSDTSMAHQNYGECCNTPGLDSDHEQCSASTLEHT